MDPPGWLTSERLVWCLLPQVEHGSIPEPTILSVLSQGLRGLGIPPPVWVARTDGVSFISLTKNQERALGPIVRVLSRGVFAPYRAASSWQRRLFPVARDAALRLVRHSGQPYQSLLTMTLHLVSRAATAEQIGSGSDVLVVSNQHSADCRLFIASAIENGTGVVYIPHAPVARNASYADLPSHFAGLRGRGEISYYEALDVPAEQLSTVGNTMVALESEWPSLSPDGPVVLALSPTSEGLVPHAAEGLAELDVQVRVVPHPGMDSKEVRALLPKRWEMHETMTVDVLREGGMAGLIQRSSGVAWEALYLGVPVIDLGIPSEVNYPVIAEPHVVFAAGDVGGAIEKARERCRDEGFRESARQWAAYWCKTTGTHAVDESVRLIKYAKNHPREQLLLDAWREPARNVMR